MFKGSFNRKRNIRVLLKLGSHHLEHIPYERQFYSLNGILKWKLTTDNHSGCKHKDLNEGECYPANSENDTHHTQGRAIDIFGVSRTKKTWASLKKMRQVTADDNWAAKEEEEEEEAAHTTVMAAVLESNKQSNRRVTSKWAIVSGEPIIPESIMNRVSPHHFQRIRFLLKGP